MRTARENAVPAAARERQAAELQMGGPHSDTGEGTSGTAIISCCRKEHSGQYQCTCKMLSETLHLILFSFLSCDCLTPIIFKLSG